MAVHVPFHRDSALTISLNLSTMSLFCELHYRHGLQILPGGVQRHSRTCAQPHIRTAAQT